MFYKGYGNELGLLGHNYPKMSHKIPEYPNSYVNAKI